MAPALQAQAETSKAANPNALSIFASSRCKGRLGRIGLVAAPRMDAAIEARRRVAITCIRKSGKEGAAGHDALADLGCAKPASEPEMLGLHLPSGRLSADLVSKRNIGRIGEFAKLGDLFRRYGLIEILGEPFQLEAHVIADEFE
jgi:hypothetical protein